MTTKSKPYEQLLWEEWFEISPQLALANADASIQRGEVKTRSEAFAEFIVKEQEASPKMSERLLAYAESCPVS